MMSNNCCQTPEQQQLLTRINHLSFAVVELLLFLDTHPNDCEEAKKDYFKFSCARKEAMEEYARLYGPLTMDYIMENEENCWKWVFQPWPWEIQQKGRC